MLQEPLNTVQIKKKLKQTTQPNPKKAHTKISASWQHNIPVLPLPLIPWLLSADYSTEETLPSSPCARYHAGECDSHSPVSDEYSGCKIKGRDTQSYAHTFNISSHPRTTSLTFTFVLGGIQELMLNLFIVTSGYHSSAPSQLNNPSPPSNKMPNILSVAGPQSLTPTSHHFLPSLPIILSLSLVPSANSAHPTQNSQGTQVFQHSSWNCASKTKSLQETFHWASPDWRINFGRTAASPRKFRMTTPGCLPVCKAFRAASQALYIHNVHTHPLAGCLLSTDPT